MGDLPHYSNQPDYLPWATVFGLYETVQLNRADLSIEDAPYLRDFFLQWCVDAQAKRNKRFDNKEK